MNPWKPCRWGGGTLEGHTNTVNIVFDFSNRILFARGAQSELAGGRDQWLLLVAGAAGEAGAAVEALRL